MPSLPIQFAVRTADEQQEVLSINLNGRSAGEAVVRYGGEGAAVDARVDLPPAAQPLPLERFHMELAEELMAYLLNRGAMAQESAGAVTYQIGGWTESLALPTHEEVGLGYPNSW